MFRFIRNLDVVEVLVELVDVVSIGKGGKLGVTIIGVDVVILGVVLHYSI